MLTLDWRKAAEYLNDPCNIPAWIKYAARLRVLDHCFDDLPGKITDPDTKQVYANRIREAFTLLGLAPPVEELALEIAGDALVGIEYLSEIVERNNLLGEVEF